MKINMSLKLQLTVKIFRDLSHKSSKSPNFLLNKLIFLVIFPNFHFSLLLHVIILP